MAGQPEHLWIFVEPAYSVWRWSLRTEDLAMICESVWQSKEGALKSANEFVAMLGRGVAVTVEVHEPPVEKPAPVVDQPVLITTLQTV